MTISILKIVAVIVILSMMILLLLSVNHLLRGDFNSRQEDIDRMRVDVEEKDEVISEDSAFRELVRVHTSRTTEPSRTTKIS